MTTRLVEFTRGGVVESVHAGTVVAVDTGGDLVATVGDPNTFAYFRSSAKPFQAVPVVESGAADAYQLTPAELALCCASHYGEAHHQAEVLAMLQKMGLDDSALQCGISLPSDPSQASLVISGEMAKTPLQCDCSGKHSGMLATCLHLGYPIDNYLDPEHPVQQEIKRVMAEVCRIPTNQFQMATDGCSAPTFGASIRAFATAFTALAAPELTPPGRGHEHAAALHRLGDAMTSHPENVAGKGALVTNMMRISNGQLIAKSGAEGLICIAIPAQRLGVAIRIADGSFRGHAVAVVSVLRQLNLLDEPMIEEIERLHPAIIRNHNGFAVGEKRAVFALNRQ